MLERRQTLETLPSGDRERIVFVLDSLMLKPAKPINLVPDSHPIKKPLRAAFCFSGIPVPADYASLIRPTVLSSPSRSHRRPPRSRSSARGSWPV